MLKTTFVIGDHVVVILKIFVADGAYPALLSNFSILQFAHFGWRSQFPIPSRVVRIVNPLDSKSISLGLGSTSRPQQVTDLWIGHSSLVRSLMAIPRDELVKNESGGACLRGESRESSAGCYNSCPRGINGEPG